MKFTRLLVPAIFALSSHAFVTESAFSQDAPDPSQTFIKSIDALGSGCPTGTYSSNLSDDRKAFTLSFSEFVAEIGPGIPLSDARKNCSITLTLQVPAGWQYSIGTFNYRGFMDVAAKVRADHSTSYFFQGTGDTGTFSATSTGPVAKDFVYTDKIGLASVYIPDQWSPCNVDRALTINPSIRLTKLAGAPANVQSIITNDTVDGELKQVFGLSWRKCGQTPPVTPPTTPTPVVNPPVGLTANGVYNLISRHSGECLDVKDHGLGNGALLQQWYCTGEDHQKFKLVLQAGQWTLVGVQSGKTISVESSKTDNGAAVLQWDNQNAPNQGLNIGTSVDSSYTVRFKHSNKCLDVSDVSSTPGALVHQWECVNADNQDWYFRPAQAFPAANTEFQLVSRNSGKCLDVLNHGLYNGEKLQQWTCTGEPHQKFRVVVQGSEGRFALVGVQSGKTVSVENSSFESGATVYQWDFQNAYNQMVTLSPSVDGSYVVHFSHSNKCLDVAAESKVDGAKVQQWDCDSKSNQDWYIKQ
ncbi:MAG: RICIN domain-containing protein [Oligoflexus sp.]|nr:RICIN domain-containing protein [Oligoflexus sp.]